MTDPAPKKAPSIASAKIEVWLAGVLMLLAFAVGFLLHGVINQPTSPAQPQPITGVPAGSIPGPLTNSQLQGGLPAGHPNLVTGQTGSGLPQASPTKSAGSKNSGNGKNNNKNSP